MLMITSPVQLDRDINAELWNWSAQRKCYMSQCIAFCDLEHRVSILSLTASVAHRYDVRLERGRPGFDSRFPQEAFSGSTHTCDFKKW